MKPLYLVVIYQPDQWNCCIWWSLTNLISETVVSGGHLPTWWVKLLYLVVIYQPDQWNCCIGWSFTNLVSETVVSGGHLPTWLVKLLYLVVIYQICSGWRVLRGNKLCLNILRGRQFRQWRAKLAFFLEFFSGGAKSIVMQISIVILLFSDQISGRGESFQGGQTASGGAPPAPLWKKARKYVYVSGNRA